MRNSYFSILLVFALFGCVWMAQAAKPGATERRRMSEVLTRIVEREVSGGAAKVQSINASRKRVRINVSIGLSYYPFREQSVHAIYDSLRALLPREYNKAALTVYTDRREISDLIPLGYRSDAARRRAIPFVNRSERPLVTPLSAAHKPASGLSGRHIALWQSHGRYFKQTENQWKWQRSQLWETCEDLYTQSYVLPYLVPMLEKAGACVMLPRERDVQTFEVLADNDAEGQYTEEQGSEPWRAGGVGFAHLRQVYLSGQNPFKEGSTRRAQSVAGGRESRAVWRSSIPEAGEYAVYVSYESQPESADDVCYTVHHLGGESSFAVNQTLGGGTWIYLGHFSFAKGKQEVVSLTNHSRLAGRMVSADAVKIGGGYGNIARTVCDSLRKVGREYLEESSGYPRFCEGARYWLQWAGFDEKVYTPKQGKDDYKDDFMSRAHWVNTLMGGSERLPDSTGLRIPVDMALAFHSDAGVRDGDGIIGTLGIYFTRDNKGLFVGGADRYLSRDLTDLVMTQVVSDIRRAYEPNWSRRGLWNRSYYEARVPSVPTMLLELLSHQNFTDMRYGNDPRFKFLVSRAVYKGILRHISAQYNTEYIVQPLPVEALHSDFEGVRGVRLRWNAVLDSLEVTAKPTQYVVYTRVGDGGFDNGRLVKGTTFLTEQEPNVVYSYKVTAVNDGGESFPSEIIAACRVENEKGRVLVVNGFDRICAPATMRQDSLAGFVRSTDTGVPDGYDISFIGQQRIFDLSMARCEDESRALGSCHSDYATEVIGGNTFDYPYLHGKAIAAAGFSFCSAAVKAVEEGDVSLADYKVVDLILGKQRATTLGCDTTRYQFRCFTPTLQREIGKLQAQGGALFVSGSYVATDLWSAPDATEADREFGRTALHCEFDGGMTPCKGRVRVVTSNARFARNEYRFCTEYVRDQYIVDAPDALKPMGDGTFAVMRYIENGRAAGVACDGPSRTFVMGFPFESITSEVQREHLMRDVLRFFTTNNN